jgi:hypothetical protein
VPKRGGNIAAIGFVLLNLKDDFAHAVRLVAVGPLIKAIA